MPPSTPDWHRTREAAALLAATAAIHEIDTRLAALPAAVAGTARTITGHLERKDVPLGFAPNWTRELRPSHGCTAVEALWESLAELRHQAIRARLAAEGHDPAALAPQGALDAAFDRLADLERDALTVSEAVAAALSEAPELLRAA